MYLHTNVENYLLKKHKKLFLTKKELALEINQTQYNIDKKMKSGEGIPRWTKFGGSNSAVMFSVVEIAIFIVYEGVIEIKSSESLFDYKHKENLLKELRGKDRTYFS